MRASERVCVGIGSGEDDEWVRVESVVMIDRRVDFERRVGRSKTSDLDRIKKCAINFLRSRGNSDYRNVLILSFLNTEIEIHYK